MSYWTYLMIDTGGYEPAVVAEIGNCTSNVAPMWHQAIGRPLGDLHQAVCANVIAELSVAVRRMYESPAVFEELNPPNGWGDAVSAREYLEKLLTECVAHPKAYIHISR